jgi:histidinol-phosphatase (PHP family)
MSRVGPPRALSEGLRDAGLRRKRSRQQHAGVIATFHNHSKWSDGTTGFGELHAHAERLGVDILGLSDHLCIYPDGTSPTWSMSPQQAPEYLADVLSYRKDGKLEVRVGLEFDWFENHGEAIASFADRIPLDYRIGSVHHVDLQQFDMSTAYWTEKSTEERDAVFAGYWRLIRGMAESTIFDIAGHLDLPKKLGFCPSAGVGAEVDAALDAIAESKMVVELNTAGFAKPCADGYPSVEILRKCRSREIPVTLSSDGHRPEDLLYEFGRGLANLHAAGFDSIARFRGRERWFEPLGDAVKSARTQGGAH